MYAKSFITEVKDASQKDAKQILDELTKGTLVGTGIGTVCGVVIGFSKGKNLIISALIGGAVGAIVSRAFINK
jgi:F0F1-type ATP synthase assembly protein I